MVSQIRPTVTVPFIQNPVNLKPMVSKISRDSPLADLIVPGYVLVSVETSDGGVYENLDTAGLSDMINRTSSDPFRKMTFHLS
mmetsp:Transcript_633/g.1001  ORF Transcript_633/g.1001 Transcript_633/m.1001 type:complete len:83 (-) Transcript_633:91-339(-)